MDPRVFSKVMRYGYALWFVAALGLLGFLAGWQIDRMKPHPDASARVLVTLLGALVGTWLGWSVVLRRRQL
jgi:hypothetical protein